jgi:hypothetical protein
VLILEKLKDQADIYICFGIKLEKKENEKKVNI